MSKVLHVFSGGLDSSVLLSMLMLEGDKYEEIKCINFFYGSKHNTRERQAAKRICGFYGIEMIELSLDFIGNLFDSALLETTKEEIPEGNYQAENMRRTVVPFRNGVMLSIAAGLADSMKYGIISAGVHAGDHYIYPDCRPCFISDMANAITGGTDSNVRLYTPFLNIDKADIIRKGVISHALFSETYSCYNGREKHCGLCGACDERKESFNAAGVDDPTEYEV